MKRIVPLNLIMDYPVSWSKYKVLRDLIQNFYDSIPHETFETYFQYELTDEGILLLKTVNTSFHYEWLIHMGASTKREQPEKYAGHFGEGFKIAALCALRDYQWNISMSSQNWILNVVTQEISIEETTMNALGYEMIEAEEMRNDTILKLYPFDKNDMEIFQSALWTFYYKKNPLFGKQIFENSSVAVYYRSNVPKPEHYPYTLKDLGDGIIFGSYQALGSLSQSLIFCLHEYRLKDRERKFFSSIDVINVLVAVIDQLSAKECITLLKEFKSYWYCYPKEKYGYKSYYSVIRKLAQKVAAVKKYRETFINQYPQLLWVSKMFMLI